MPVKPSPSIPLGICTLRTKAFKDTTGDGWATSSGLDTLACSIGFRRIAELDLRTRSAARPEPAEPIDSEELRDKPDDPHARRRPPMRVASGGGWYRSSL